MASAPAFWIMFVIDWAAVPVGLFAFLHALVQRADAYTAVDRLTKPAWIGITAAGTAALALFRFYEYGMFFWIAGLVAVLVYLVDVRPRLIQAQRGHQR